MEITSYKSVTIQEMMTRLQHHKHNPSTIQQVIYEYLDEVTEGKVDVVDPTNPFVFLLESSSVNTAVAINENIVNLRKQYPSLAQSEEDIYMHLSDRDYLNRFCTPCETEFTVVVQYNDLSSRMVYSETEKAFKATIARDTVFQVDDYEFTLQYPIDIKRYENGTVQISYDASITSKLDLLKTNIIDYVVRKDVEGINWIFFKVNVKQFKIESVNFPIQRSIAFQQRIPFPDQYYYLRAYQRNDNTLNQWREIKTTHTDQVFDSRVATVLIRVFSNEVEVSIPIVYLTTGLIQGEIRFDIYTSKGKVILDFTNYKTQAFSMTNRAIDEQRDANQYVSAFSASIFHCFNDQTVSGGTDGVGFDTLRQRVIDNTVGNVQIPITNVQVEAFVNDQGFDLVKNVDAVTNRVFLATQKLPKPLNTKLITPANIGISSFISNIQDLKQLSSVSDNGSRITLKSKNLFINNNGIVTIIKPSEVESLKLQSKISLITNVNQKHYLYNPFYYVLDNTDEEFELRAYNLDYPKASNINFVSQNQTIQLPVNTGQYTLTKIAKGYRLRIVTKSGNIYRNMQDDLVQVQISYYPKGENRLAFINGTLVGKTEAEDRIYDFDIETNYDITTEHALAVTNAKMFGNEFVQSWVDLDLKINIFYTTTSLVDGFITDQADSLVGKFLLPDNAVAVTWETIDLTFGSRLKNLWTRSRSLASGLDYQRHEENVPLVYGTDQYEIDPVTGSIFTFDSSNNIQYSVKHKSGDPVLDSNGEQVYKHRRGDVVLDSNGKPKVVSSLVVNKEMDLLFVDGRHFFVDDKAFIEYNDELVSILNSWITDSLSDVQDILLEQSKIFFYPKTTLGKVSVYIENQGTDQISSEQSLTVDLYVKSNVYSDNSIRQQLIDNTVRIIDDYISGMTINTTELVILLNNFYKDSVQSIDISGLGAQKNYRIINLTNEQNRLCLKKILYLQADNTIIIKEDVTINFYEVQ